MHQAGLDTGYGNHHYQQCHLSEGFHSPTGCRLHKLASFDLSRKIGCVSIHAADATLRGFPLVVWVGPG